MANGNPHNKLNEHNAILINTKNSTYYNKAYEHTIYKNL